MSCRRHNSLLSDSSHVDLVASLLIHGAQTGSPRRTLLSIKHKEMEGNRDDNVMMNSENRNGTGKTKEVAKTRC